MTTTVEGTGTGRWGSWPGDKELRTILFLHIPKAAGTTLGTMLAQKVRSESVLTIQNTRTAAEELASLPDASRDKLELIRGHFAYGLHQGLRQPFEYITMLRNPVDRVVSHYYYVLRQREHYLHERVTSQNISLKDYAAVAGMTKELDNGQVRFISGMFYRDPNGQCSRDLLEHAKENLQKHFAVVGLAERFDETLPLLAQRYGWKDVTYVKKNTAPDRPNVKELPADTVEAIMSANALDVELYALASELFEAALRQERAAAGDFACGSAPAD